MTPMTAPTPARSLAEQIEGWSPGPVVRSDDLSRAPALALPGLLGPGAAAAPQAIVPPLWTCVYFLEWTPLAGLGLDGHPAGGGFLPPLADRRRVFAGGRATFRAPLRFGETATATSTLAASAVKSGRTGELLLVTVRTETTQGGQLALTEEQDLIYRSGPAPARPAGAGAPAADAGAPGSPGTALRGGPGHALRVQRADRQLPSHPLRPALRSGPRGLPGAARARPAARGGHGGAGARGRARAAGRRDELPVPAAAVRRGAGHRHRRGRAVGHRARGPRPRRHGAGERRGRVRPGRISPPRA